MADDVTKFGNVTKVECQEMSTRLACVLLVLSGAVACGSSDSPVGPTGSQVANVAGVWTYSAALTGTVGGECVGPLYNSGIMERGTLAITQNGANLTAVETNSGNGSACSYTGTVGQGSMSLNMTSCQIAVLFSVRCVNGALRDMRMLSQAITVNVNGPVALGSRGTTANIFIAGTATGVGLLTITTSYNLTR